MFCCMRTNFSVFWGCIVYVHIHTHTHMKNEREERGSNRSCWHTYGCCMTSSNPSWCVIHKSPSLTHFFVEIFTYTHVHILCRLLMYVQCYKMTVWNVTLLRMPNVCCFLSYIYFTCDIIALSYYNSCCRALVCVLVPIPKVKFVAPVNIIVHVHTKQKKTLYSLMEIVNKSTHDVYINSVIGGINDTFLYICVCTYVRLGVMMTKYFPCGFKFVSFIWCLFKDV